MVRLLIVDDHPLVRRGVVEVLDEAFPGGTIGEASDGAEALQAVYDGMSQGYGYEDAIAASA